MQEGAQINIYDPKVSKEQMYFDLMEPGVVSNEQDGNLRCRGREDLFIILVMKSVTVFDNAYDAAKSADAVVVLTEWDEFKELNYSKIYQTMKKPAFVFDGRLILDHKQLKEIGFNVEVIGKQI